MSNSIEFCINNYDSFKEHFNKGGKFITNSSKEYFDKWTREEDKFSWEDREDRPHISYFTFSDEAPFQYAICLSRDYNSTDHEIMGDLTSLFLKQEIFMEMQGSWSNKEEFEGDIKDIIRYTVGDYISFTEHLENDPSSDTRLTMALPIYAEIQKD